MKKTVSFPSLEPRWPIALTVLAVMTLVTVLPDRVSLLPDWLPSVVGIVVLMPMLAVAWSRGGVRWLRLERTILSICLLVVGFGNVVSLGNLIDEILTTAKVLDGLQLLTSSIAVWVTNVLVFALVYWQSDRGGPEARLNGGTAQPDWQFTQDGQPETERNNWCPAFVDYLFLAYSTATAFSACDTLPLTHRAKLMLMLESATSLTTTVVVASRAINILGT